MSMEHTPPRYYASTYINSNQDPCSLAYQRQSIQAKSSIKSTPRKTCRVKIRKARVAFVRNVKKIFGIKPKSTATFLMPYEVKRMSQSSTRSRPSSTKMTSPSPTPAPPMNLKRHSARRKRSSYRVHSFAGTGSPAMAKKTLVRFSHPVVVNELIPTPSYDAAPIDDDDADQPDDNIREVSMVTDETPLELEDGQTPLRPKNIWRWSNQSVTVDGTRESYDDFKARLDGHKRRADREQPPSLQYIPRMASIKLAEATRKSEYVTFETTDQDKHRSDALDRLEGSAAPTSKSRYVLAIVPREHLPITAVQLTPDQYSSSLLPGANPQAHLPKRRPYTFAASTPAGSVYKAYNPFAESAASLASAKSDSDLRADKKTVSFAIDAQLQQIFEPTPFDASNVSDFNQRHSRHYQHVESGIFDEPVPSRPIESDTNSIQVSPAGSISEGTFLLPPTPPSSPSPRHPQLKILQEKKIARKPAPAPSSAPNFSKPLPPTPTTTTAPSSKPLVPFSMNDSFQRFDLQQAKRFSAEAKYQRRSVDAVEAKFMKEHPKKTSKTKTTEKRAQSEKDKKKLAELSKLDSQLKKIMFA